MRRVVITGAPGAGKTVLLQALQSRGYAIVGDMARRIIQERRRRGLSPRPDPQVFAQEVLRLDIENYELAAGNLQPVFFERGVLDAVCGLDRVSPLSESELSTWLSDLPVLFQGLRAAAMERDLRERCRARSHVRACRVGGPDHAGMVRTMRI